MVDLPFLASTFNTVWFYHYLYHPITHSIVLTLLHHPVKHKVVLQFPVSTFNTVWFYPHLKSPIRHSVFLLASFVNTKVWQYHYLHHHLRRRYSLTTILLQKHKLTEINDHFHKLMQFQKSHTCIISNTKLTHNPENIIRDDNLHFCDCKNSFLKA